MRKPIVLIGCLAMLVSCGGADRGSSASSSGGCEQGLRVESGAGPVCVFRRDQALVIEGGFDCPADFEFRIDTASAIACSRRSLETLPVEVCAKIPGGCDNAEAEPQAGASAEPDNGSGCGHPSGDFDASYQIRNGNCGEVSSTNPVPIDDNNVTIEKFADRDVQTEVVIQGCELAVTQTVRGKDDGNLDQQVQGSALEIESPTQISGLVTVTRFDSSGQPECSGEYDLTLTQSASQ